MGLFDRILRRGDDAAPTALPDFDAEQAKAEAAGSFRGKHFTEWAPVVDKFREDGNLDASLALAYECINATERQDAVQGSGVASAYYWDAAVVLRTQKRYAEEVQVLERYLARSGRSQKFDDRLRKATAFRDAEATATPPACPSCGTALESPPKSRGKCPSCAQALVMRTVNGQRVALTPEQVSVQADREKAERSRSQFLKRLGYFDVSDADWDRVHAEQAARFGRPSTDGDVYWQLANERAVSSEQASNWTLAGRIRSDMAKFSVEEGRDWVASARLAEQNWMKALAQFDSPATEMILIACPCDVCQPDHQTVRTLGQFTTAWPLPHADCGRPPCRCRVTRRMY